MRYARNSGNEYMGSFIALFCSEGPSYDVGHDNVLIYWRADGLVVLKAKAAGKHVSKMAWQWRHPSDGMLSKPTKSAFSKQLELRMNDSSTTSGIFWYEYGRTRSGTVRIREGGTIATHFLSRSQVETFLLCIKLLLE